MFEHVFKAQVYLKEAVSPRSNIPLAGNGKHRELWTLRDWVSAALLCVPPLQHGSRREGEDGRRVSQVAPAGLSNWKGQGGEARKWTWVSLLPESFFKVSEWEGWVSRDKSCPLVITVPPEPEVPTVLSILLTYPASGPRSKSPILSLFWPRCHIPHLPTLQWPTKSSNDLTAFTLQLLPLSSSRPFLPAFLWSQISSHHSCFRHLTSPFLKRPIS